MVSKRLQRDEPRRRNQTNSVFSIVKQHLQDTFGGSKKSKRKPSIHSRSFAPAAIYKYEAFVERLGLTHEELVAEEEFFDEAIGSSSVYKQRPAVKQSAAPKVKAQTAPANKASKSLGPSSSGVDKWNVNSRKKREQTGRQLQGDGERGREKRRPAQQQRRTPDEEVDTSDDDTPLENFVEFFDNSDRKQQGLSFVKRIFGSGGASNDKNFKPRRPYFTWWVTFLQIIIYIVSVAVYGIAPIGISTVEESAQVLMTSLAVEQVSYKEAANMWIGPRQDDLIHLGARYSPCMRVDRHVEDVMTYDRDIEQQTACCIYNDGSGCVQSTETRCPITTATWFNWTDANRGYQNRTSGSVCGQDPKYCSNPSSSGAFIWVDDITQWPTCTEKLNTTARYADNVHMTCEVAGRPCCVGIQGECVIATREYCKFRRGYFHENATLCSQVKCIEEICGMFPFANPAKPDQFYRFITSMFLHAGAFSLLITVIFQFLIMRELERISGWWRITIVYIGGGVAGSLASATFLPYHVEAGPSGAQFATLASLIVEIFRWYKDDSPYKVLLKIIGMLVILFALGLLPGIDNWAHLFGFLYGIFLGVAFRPYKSIRKRPISKPVQIICVVVSLVLSAGTFVVVVVLFYVWPVYECAACSYFNCIPFTADFCNSMKVTIGRTMNHDI